MKTNNNRKSKMIDRYDKKQNEKNHTGLKSTRARGTI